MKEVPLRQLPAGGTVELLSFALVWGPLEEAVGRWKAIKTELALMASSESLSQDDIASYERSVAEATDDAAEDLADALRASTDR